MQPRRRPPARLPAAAACRAALPPFHTLHALTAPLPAHPPALPRRSKFVSGVLGSRTSPTLLLAGGLMATAALNIAFGYSTSIVWFCTWWAMNGMLQARGVGARCAVCGVGAQADDRGVLCWACCRMAASAARGRSSRRGLGAGDGAPHAPRQGASACLASQLSLPHLACPLCPAAGRGRALLRPHPHLLVRRQGARHVLE